MPGTIVSPEVAHEHLRDPKWVFVDCRHALADFSLGRKQYEAGHIPGAYFADVEHDLAGEKTGSNGRHPLPSEADFTAYLRSLGVDDDTQVVAYDAGGDMFAARLWYLLRLWGHDAVAVLDGGYAAWTGAGFETGTAVPQRANGSIVLRWRDDLAVDAAFVERNLESPEMHLVDARGADRFAGQNEIVDPVAGHIPGARNRPFKTNFDESGRFKSADALRREFENLGLDASRVVHQCGSGVSAAVNMLAMEIAGNHGSRVYPGSWSEWIADASRPIVTP